MVLRQTAFGQRIRDKLIAYWEEHGYTHKQLAELTGLSQIYFYSLGRGSTSVSIDSAIIISNAIGFDLPSAIKEIMGEKDGIK